MNAESASTPGRRHGAWAARAVVLLAVAAVAASVLAGWGPPSWRSDAAVAKWVLAVLVLGVAVGGHLHPAARTARQSPSAADRQAAWEAMLAPRRYVAFAAGMVVLAMGFQTNWRPANLLSLTVYALAMAAGAAVWFVVARAEPPGTRGERRDG